MSGYDNEAAKYTSSGQSVVVNDSCTNKCGSASFADPSALQNRIEKNLSHTLLWRGVVTFACGLLTTVFGCLAMYFYSEIDQLKWPMSSASGIWAGLLAAFAGVHTIYVSKVAGEETVTKANPSLLRWMYGFHVLNIMVLTTSIQHTTYSGMAIGKIWIYDASLVITVLMDVTGLMILIMSIHNMVWLYTKCKPMGIAPRGCRR